MKFLKNYNLLTLQLQDPYFRKILMLQVLIFLFTLKHQSSKNPQLPLSESDKKTMEGIDLIAVKYLKFSVSPDNIAEGTRVYE